MSRKAWTYIWTILIAGFLLTIASLLNQPLPLDQVPALLVLMSFATLAQLFKAEMPNHQLYYATMVFLFAAVILLHPFFFVLVVLVPHLIEWVKERLTKSRHLRDWYLQPFNIAMHIVTGLSAQWLYVELNVSGADLTVASIGAGIAAVFCYAILNRLLLGQALVLGRGRTWRESGVLALDSVVTDLIQLCLGYIVAVLWSVHPLLMVPALTPLILIYRALTVPQLKQEARTDAKTGLWNARHFTEQFQQEMERAARFQRPLSIIMADLDLLRNINNTYGHLAGDVVLAGVGRIIADTVREYDMAGRFGGEEFIIALPETLPDEAFRVAERLRKAVEGASFEVKTSVTPIHATMSLGIACFPEHAVTANDLVHEADVAVYQAKLRGRNQSIYASPEDRPTWDEPERVERLNNPYAAPFTPRPEALNGTGPVPEVPDELEPLPSMMDNSVQAGAPAPTTAMGMTTALRPSVERLVESAPAPPLAEPPVTESKKSRFGRGGLYVAEVIVGGIVATLFGMAFGGPLDLQLLLLLAGLAMTAEFMQLDLYSEANGDKTISISVALNFAAALMAGVPGVAAVSAGIALIHWARRRPPLYKSVFNWAMHTLAGVIPAVTIALIGLPVTIQNVPVLFLPAFLAAVAYYLVDTGLLTGAIALTEGVPFRAIWQKHFRWLAHHYLVLCVLGFFFSGAYLTLGWLGAFVFALPVLTMRLSQQQYIDRTKENITELERMNAELSAANREINEANHAIRQLNDELFMTVAHILDARDPFVSGHAAKVADYATALALEMGLSEEDVMLARQGGLLHDIGKIGIKESVLYKPSRLTDEEFEHIKTHVTVGASLLETSRSLRHLSPFVRHHHERWDGNGYPDRLAGESTPLIARILAVADAVEAMASDRPYHRGMPLTDIIEEVKRCSGAHFDPQVAAAFVRIMERDGGRLVTNSAREVAERQGGVNVNGSTFNTGSGWYIQLPGKAPSTVA